MFEESEEVGFSPFDFFALCPFLLPETDSSFAKVSDISPTTFCDTCIAVWETQPLIFTWNLKDNFHVVGFTVATLQIVQVPRSGGWDEEIIL